MNAERVSYEHLLGIFACLALALVAHITALPAVDTHRRDRLRRCCA